MKDIRTSFDEAVTTFRAFLRSQGWSDNILWLTRERITGHYCRYWVFRPEDLISDTASRHFYEAIRQGPGSIRVDALAQFNGKTICYVHDWGGDSRLLNFGTLQGPMELKAVQSQILWFLILFINRLKGESPFLKETRITPNAEPSAGAYALPRAAQP